MNEYEMLYLIRQKDEEAETLLIQSFQRKIYQAIYRMKHKLNYHSTTSDEDEELFNLCNQALLNAVNSYQDFKGASFSYYATCCIETAIRTYIRNKRTRTNQGLATAFSLDACISEKEGLYYVDVIENNNPWFDPRICVSRIEQEKINQDLRKILSSEEYRVYELRLLGYNNREIAEKLAKSKRRISYIHGKIKKLLVRYID